MPLDPASAQPLVPVAVQAMSIGAFSMTDLHEHLIGLLRELNGENILLAQASIIILIPYLFWRTLGLSRWMPLGIVQIIAGVLLGPAIRGRAAPDLFNALFGQVVVNGQSVSRAGPIFALATIAVCLFGFLTGAETDKD